MTERQYVTRLLWAHRNEVFGEAAYAMAARLTRRRDRRRKWEALTRLETQTKLRLAGALTAAGVRAPDRGVGRWLGCAVGGAAGLLPWRVAMTVLGVITRCATPFFERLDLHPAAIGGARVDGLAAHERAQGAFARRELAGDGLHSLDDVLDRLRDGLTHGGVASTRR